QQEVKLHPPARHGMPGFGARWSGFMPANSNAAVDTAVPYETLWEITQRLTEVPDSFTMNPKLARLLEVRRADMERRQPVDWALAESLALGALLLEGTPVRLSGQDSRRGTFSQRHAVLYDAKTGERFLPLNSLGPGQAPYQVYDSPLAETAVLGFEFGYS